MIALGDLVEGNVNVPMEVQRADGRIEFDAETDGYSVLCERARAAIVGLAKMDRAVLHTRPVAALYVTGRVERAGSIDMTPTVLSPTDPELAGALVFGGLMSLRKHDPAAFAVVMRRLAGVGVI